ncbi:hypothetical protein ASF30_12160 [Leifsonia sp. Leaf264]|nr:hypothetical protein ASF30_12160 [Leifsonia sp. Leaf264]
MACALLFMAVVCLAGLASSSQVSSTPVSVDMWKFISRAGQIATVGSVVVSAVAIMSDRMNSAKERAAQTGIQREAARPYVTIGLTNRVPEIILVVTNHGSTAARDLKFSISPRPYETDLHEMLNESVMMTEGLPILAPKESVATLFDVVGEYLARKSPNRKYRIKVSYVGPWGDRHQDTFTLDLESSRGLLTPGDTTKQRGAHALGKLFEGV